MPKNTSFKRIGLFLGPILFFLILLLELDPNNPKITKMAAIAVLMSIWWITDAIPLYATALIPVVLFPVFGIMSGKEIAPTYFNRVIFLFIGGFLIALSMERWSLHKRIALFIIKIIGTDTQRIILGFMIASAFLSMWISNTATAIMMLPIGLAIISRIENKFGKTKTKNFTLSLMIGIAYACSIGGIATLVGTPPNLSFARIYEITFPEANPITFGTWFTMGLPLSICLLFVSWIVITKIIFRQTEKINFDSSIIKTEYRNLGRMKYEEKVVLIIFSLTAILWIFRTNLNLGIFTVPGWSALVPNFGMIDDSTVAIFMALLLFLIPSKSKDGNSSMIAGADVVKKLPWDIILLFGGGFALAKGFQVSGLSPFIGTKFVALSDVNPILVILTICLSITFLTELTSNTATTEMILPILASVSIAMKINPLLIMIPATISASCAFMMPVATPPNAIVFGSGKIKISDMVRSGILLNLIAVVLVTLFFYFIGTKIFGVDISRY